MSYLFGKRRSREDSESRRDFSPTAGPPADRSATPPATAAAVAVEAVPARELLVDAHALAVTTGLTVYDSMYVALALRLKTEMITADDRLGRTVAAHPMAAVQVRLVQMFE